MAELDEAPEVPTQGSDAPELPTPEPEAATLPRRRELTAWGLAAVAVGGLCLGGWFGQRPASGLSAAQRDVADVRLDPAFDQRWSSACSNGKADTTVILHNYGPGSVKVSSVTVDADWKGVAAQPLSTTIGPGKTAAVEFALSKDMTACGTKPPAFSCDRYGESVLYAKFTVTPASGHSHSTKLPIAAWEGNPSVLNAYPLTNPREAPSSKAC